MGLLSRETLGCRLLCAFPLRACKYRLEHAAVSQMLFNLMHSIPIIISFGDFFSLHHRSYSDQVSIWSTPEASSESVLGCIRKFSIFPKAISDKLKYFLLEFRPDCTFPDTSVTLFPIIYHSECLKFIWGLCFSPQFVILASTQAMICRIPHIYTYFFIPNATGIYKKLQPQQRTRVHLRQPASYVSHCFFSNMPPNGEKHTASTVDGPKAKGCFELQCHQPMLGTRGGTGGDASCG